MCVHRGRLPLRGSPGFAPGSLYASLYANGKMKNQRRHGSEHRKRTSMTKVRQIGVPNMRFGYMGMRKHPLLRCGANK